MKENTTPLTREQQERLGELFAAAVLGTIAFNTGKGRVPHFDQELHKLMAGKQVGEGLPLFKAWCQAWDDAQVAYEIKLAHAS